MYRILLLLEKNVDMWHSAVYNFLLSGRSLVVCIVYTASFYTVTPFPLDFTLDSTAGGSGCVYSIYSHFRTALLVLGKPVLIVFVSDGLEDSGYRYTDMY